MRKLFLIAAVLASSAVHAQAPSAPDLSDRLAKAYAKVQMIDARADRVDDINELRNLQQIYGYYVDEALWDEVVALFSDDGTLENAFNGVYVGKESIRKYLYSLTGGKPGLAPGELNNHFQLSPVLTLAPDGESAKGRWRALIQTGSFGKGSGGNWGEGIYENDYVREGGVWKIRKLHFFVKFYAPYEGGWTRGAKDYASSYGKSKVKPARPASVKYEAFPSQFTPPFHYENPVATSYVFGGDWPEKTFKKPVTPGRVSAQAIAPAAAAAPSAAPSAAPAASPPKTVAEMEAQVRALELKLERLQSVDELDNLEAMYGFYVDQSMQDAISALFTDQATLEILGRGVFIGKDRIYEYMRRLGAPTPGNLFNHMQLQPVVHVAADGNTAQIRARLFVMFGQLNRSAQWGEGVYENTFVKENGVWKYKNLHGFQTFYTNYEGGWARHSAGMFAPFAGYPPDMPQSIPYEVYPAVFVPPFHYRNPVTGK
jgi:hypothetical protein